MESKTQKSYANKYQRLVCVDDKFSKPAKIYLCQDAVYNFINNMIETKVDIAVKWWKNILTKGLW